MTISRFLRVALLPSFSLIAIQAVALDGVIQGPDGLPVEGASIYYLRLGPDVENGIEVRLLDETDEAGRFEVDTPEGFGYSGSWLLVDKEPFAISFHAWNLNLQQQYVLRGERGLVVTLEEGIEIKGTLKTPEGLAIRDAVVAPILPDSNIGMTMGSAFHPRLDTLYSVKTDTNGQFTLRRMPEARNYALRLYDPAQGWSFFGINASDYRMPMTLSTSQLSVDAVFKSRGSIEGVVLSRETGEPLSNAKVSAVLARAYHTGMFLPTIETTTNEDGAYRLEGLPSAYYSLKAHAEGKYNVPITSPMISETSVAVEPLYLGDGVRVSGRIVDALSGETVRDADIAFTLSREGVRERQTAPVLGDDGTFEWTSAAGWITLGVINRDRDVLPADKYTRLILVPGHDHEIAIRVKDFDTADIRVLMPDGTPAEGAIVFDKSLREERFVCDEMGWVHFPIRAERFGEEFMRKTVEAYWPDDELLRGMVALKLTSPQEAKAVITLQPTATVIGASMDDEGNRLGEDKIEIIVALPDSNFRFGHTFTSYEEKQFTISHIVPGLEYSFNWGKNRLRRVFQPGEVFEWEIDLKLISPELLDTLSPKAISNLPPELKRQLGIEEGNN